MNATELWAAALPLLMERVGKATHDGVLKQAEAKSFDGVVLKLAVGNDFVRRAIADRHRAIVEAALAEIAGETVVVAVAIDESLKSEAPAPPTVVLSANDAIVDGQLNPAYTFDSFTAADCNRFAHAAAQQVAKNPGRAYNPLFLHSKPGLGKTHLMLAIAHQIKASTPSANIEYVSAEDFVNDLTSAIRDHRTAEFRRRYRYVDVWLVDDIQFIAAIEGPVSEEEFFHTLNTLSMNDKQVVIASDAPPRQLSIMNDRLRSRLEMGILADLRPPDPETRIAILKKKAAEVEQTVVPRPVIEEIAARVEDNVRVLCGALKTMCAFYSLMGYWPEGDEFDERLSQFTQSCDAHRVSLNEIAAYVAGRHEGVSVGDITGPKRSKDIAWPRQLVVYLAKVLTNHTLADIGNFLGGRDHSTILYAYNKVADLVEEDERWLREINVMKLDLRQAG